MILTFLATLEPSFKMYILGSKSTSKASKASKATKKNAKQGMSAAVELPPDPSLWVDFCKFCASIVSVSIYYKPSNLEGYRVSDIAQGVSSKSEPEKKEKPAIKTLLLAKNEPTYIFVDSLDYKLILVNLAQTGNVCALNQPVITEEKNTFSCVVVENHDWQNLKVTEPALTFINTWGSKSACINAPPGRHIFQAWIRSDSHHVTYIMSDQPILLGRLEIVLEHMTQESQRLTQMCNNISVSFARLVQHFGTSDYRKARIEFYSSCLPENKISNIQAEGVRSSLISSFVKTLRENCPDQEFKALERSLKVLLLEPQLEDLYKDEHFAQAGKEEQNAATVIQAFFRGILVRKLKSVHSPAHKDHMKTFDALKKIYADFFGVKKRLQFCLPLLRNVFFSDEGLQFREAYPVFADLKSVILLQQLTGSVWADNRKWIPLLSHSFFINSPRPVRLMVCFSCNLLEFKVCIFNNDSKQEVSRYTNSIVVDSYSTNLNGYTVLCYGWTKDAQKVEWKLNLVTMREKEHSLILLGPGTPNRSILKGNYSPNVFNRICKCIVPVSSDGFVSFHFSTNYEQVKFKVLCLDEDERVVVEAYGIGEVVLPLVHLKYTPILDVNLSNSALDITSAMRKGSKSEVSKKHLFALTL